MTHEIRILIVDDERDQREAVAAVLEDLGHTLCLASTGEEAIAQVTEHDFAVVLMDMMMPGLDGIQTAARIGALNLGRLTPIVFLSGSSQGKLGALRAYSAGAIDFLFKPADPVVLRSKVEVFATLARQREELAQTRKLEAIGRLAGGIAHDFNNMLTVISGQCALLLERASTDRDRDDLTDIKDAAERSAALTRQLLAYSRKQILRPHPIDLNRVVGAIMPMLSRLVGSLINVRVQTDPQVGMVTADPAQIEQVIVNLVLNARDALPRGGRIEVQTRVVEIRRDLTGAPAGPQSYAELSVQDTGTGMDEATRKRIFEPFYTTKGAGQGIGMGLSTVDGIVAQTGGHIDVESKLGHGTTFRVRLPMTAAAQPASGPSETANASTTVLLVEDEAAIRRMARSMLAKAGYTVIEAPSGQDALAIARQPGVKIDLVVTDVVMPEMNGVTTYEAVRALHPEARVLYISGYPDTGTVGGISRAAGTSFLEKPFTGAALCQAVRQVIDESGN